MRKIVSFTLIAVASLFLFASPVSAQGLDGLTEQILNDAGKDPLAQACQKETPGEKSAFCTQLTKDANVDAECAADAGALGADVSACTEFTNPLINILRIVLNIISAIAAALAIIFIIVGAIRYSASRGNTEAIATAKKTIIYAIFGLMLALFAGAIVAFFLDVTTDDGSGTPTVATSSGDDDSDGSSSGGSDSSGGGSDSGGGSSSGGSDSSGGGSDSGGDDSPTQQDEEEEVISTKTFQITSGNYGFLFAQTTAQNPVIIVDPGDIVTIVLTSSLGEHNWTVPQIPSATTASVNPGDDAVSVTFEVPTVLAGETLSYFSSVGNDRELGMEGVFEITNNIP